MTPARRKELAELAASGLITLATDQLPTPAELDALNAIALWFATSPTNVMDAVEAGYSVGPSYQVGSWYFAPPGAGPPRPLPWPSRRVARRPPAHERRPVTCEFCTDTPFRLGPFGPCVCATPEALLAALELESYGLRSLSDDIAQAIGTVEFMDPPDGGDVSLPEQVRRMREALTALRDEREAVVATLRKNPDVAAPKDGELDDTVEEALDAAYAQGEDGKDAAADALVRYLVRQGLPAAPLRLDDPDLDALADALL